MPAQDLLEELLKIETKVRQTQLPQELQERTLAMVANLGRMAKFGAYSTEYEHLSRYIDWICSLPWNKRSTDILDLIHTQKTLDKNHYGLGQVKERVLEYLAVLKL